MLGENLVDALAMEKLTASPRVVDIFGYCGTSLNTEFGGRRLRDVIKAMHKTQPEKQITPQDKLRLGIEIAKGLAEVHGHLNIAHNDLHSGNIIFDSQWRPKLNDFNLAKPLMHDKRTGRMCAKVRDDHASSVSWRPPEEYLDKANDAFKKDKPILMWQDKTDVYALGTSLYRLAAEVNPWKGDLSDKKQQRREFSQMKAAGTHPAVPKDILTSKDRDIQKLLAAASACHRFAPLERPTALEVVTMLEATI